MAAIYLLVGLAIGYLVRGGQSDAPSTRAVTTAGAAPLHPGPMGAGHMPTAQQMKQMADKQAAPLMEKLKSNPKDSASLMQVGAIYYTTGQFKQASAYYEKALQAEPGNVADRVKLATSLYRDGDVDGAIAQLNQALTYDPKDANTLFDLGMMKLQGKQDSKGALAAWHQLLKSNPQLSADHKAQVQRLMASVADGNSRAQASASEGAAGK
jgi:cytochrome c-type biogenesis protein CcmH/NrfG